MERGHRQRRGIAPSRHRCRQRQDLHDARTVATWDTLHLPRRRLSFLDLVLTEIGGQRMLLEERSRLNLLDSYAIIRQAGVLPVHLDGYTNSLSIRMARHLSWQTSPRSS